LLEFAGAVFDLPLEFLWVGQPFGFLTTNPDYASRLANVAQDIDSM
jgi:hypothetical protein